MQATDKYSIHVAAAAPALVLTPGDPNNVTALPDEAEGVSMTEFDIVASGGTGPYTFTVGGNLPDGVQALSDNVDTLRITGTPAAGASTGGDGAGNYDFTVQAMDSLGAQAKTARFAHKIG